MNNTELKKQLQLLDGCEPAITWLGRKSLSTAWKKCERPEWMIWYLGMIGYGIKTITLIACDCASTALKYVPGREDRPKVSIDTAIRFIAGESTITELNAASEAASEAAWSARDAARAAAWSASDAARSAARAAASEAAWSARAAARAAAWSARDAARAASDAARAAASEAASDAAWSANKEMCDLIRSRVSVEMIENHLEESAK